MPNTEHAARYREIRRLGVGGMATVSLAEDTVLGRPVALKRVHGGGDERGMLRLKREAMVGASLNHPNLVFVYDAQLREDGDVVIVMEYVEGETLADLIESRGAFPPSEAMRVLHAVAAALDAIHARGIVHRDVKPANVLLGHDGAVKLADLGVADVADRTRITESGAVVGSFRYMAPEQLDGRPPTPAVDVYALAAVAYEMLSGERARPEANPLALAHAISNQPPPDLRAAWPAAPAAVAAALQRGMSADPTKRPTSAGELVHCLEVAFEPERPTRIAPLAPPARPSQPRAAAIPASQRPTGQPRRRIPILVPGLLGLAALAVAAVLIAAISSGGEKSSGSSSSTPRTIAHRRSASRSTPSAASKITHTASRSSAGAHAGSAATAGAESTTSSSGTTATTSSTPAAGPAPAPPSGASPGSPAGAVEQFYTAAARHDYPAAWALAGPDLRSQLGGYAAFQHLFSSVRSITFQSAQPLAGSTSGTATVALRTTSVQTDRTQRCAGTARTVHSGGGWLLDGISINCS